MTPILASGAASLAGVLVNRITGSSSSSSASNSANIQLDPKAFERTLNQARDRRHDASELQAAGAELRRKLLQQPEIEAAMYAQPAGSVSAVSINADGSVALQTSRGPVAVHLSEQTRAMAQSLYTASAVQGTAGPSAMGGSTQSPILVPLQSVLSR